MFTRGKVRDRFLGCGLLATMAASGVASDSQPVDLAGSYWFAGDGSTVSASTLGADRVAEPAGAQEGTYTPYSDTQKPPQILSLSLLQRSFECDVSCGGDWATDVDGVADRVRLGSLAGSAAVVVERALLGYRFRDPDDDSIFYADLSGATRFRVVVQVDAAGQKTLNVTTVNGTSPGTGATSSLNAHGPSGAPAGFRVALCAGIGRKGTGHLQVNSFTVTAPANALYLYADDAYVRPGETIDYRLGMANLAQPIGGFQAFLVKQGSLSAQGYVTGIYTSTPFPSARFWGDPIPSSLYVGAGIPFGGNLVTADARLANLYFAGATPGSVGLGILANQGAFETVFTDDLGIPYYPSRHDSNRVVIDGTSPVVNSVLAEQLGANGLDVGLAAGPATISAHVSDSASGLGQRPTVRIDYAPIGDGPEDETYTTYSTAGPNVFAVDVDVPQGKLTGPGRLLINATDDAGNTVTNVSSFLVARRFSGTIDLQDYDGDLAAWTATIEFRAAGSGTNVASRTVGLASDGTFVLNQVVPDGTYDIRAKAPHWLAQIRWNEVLSEPELSGLDFSLRNADCNDDNVVDIADYAILSFSYGTSLGDPTYDVLADLNGDEAIDIADYAILSANYSAFGDD